MTKRILHLTTAYPPSVGGIEDHVEKLSSRLPKWGYKPVVLTPNRAPDQTHYDDVTVYRESILFGLRKSAFAPRILTRLFTVEYDLIHVHAPFHFGLEFALMIKLLRDKPLIITVHMYDARDSILYALYEKTVCNLALDMADWIIPTTWDYVKDYKVFQKNSEKTTPIPLAVDTDFYTNVESAREQLGYSSDEKILLFVGAMEKHHFYKDVEGLIEAFAQTNSADRLVLIGRGDLVPKLIKKAESEGVGDCVEFPGYVAEEKLPTYYSAADLFVLPSKADRGEAFGLVLLEAMACGTPVLTTDIPGVRTVVGKGGLTVSPDSVTSLKRGIEKAIEDTFQPREQVINNNSLDKMTEKIIAVYEKFD